MNIDEDVLGELHEPTDEAFASYRLELHRPVREGDDSSKNGWQELKKAHRAIGQAVQRALGDIVVHVGSLRTAGKTRFATPSEKANAKLGIPLPVECYTDEDLKIFAGLVTRALRGSAVTEYVYSSVARRLLHSELSGEKLKDLLRGDTFYPVIRRVGVMMRARNWKLSTGPRVANGKTYLEVAIETSALFPGSSKMTFICKGLHGPTIGRWKKGLEALAALGLETSGGEGGWAKGAITLRPVRRPGQPEKWEIIVPYCAPRMDAGGDVTVAIHRSVANMLSAATSTGDVYHFPGRAVVALKAQLYARRKPIQRELSAMPHRGRGARKHFAALAKLQDKERRATQTNLWRAARWVQNIVERVGARIVLLDDFASFDPDRPGPPFEPYVRRFPLADLKIKIVDAITRRAGVTVQEIKSFYISQECPECGHVHTSNIARLPVIRGIDVEKGWFKCVKCSFSADLDKVAALNELNRYASRPATPKRSAK